ncbi:hypothetical protein CDAR_444821 [Caerostris darwini]|uniref:Uncharacterized protein n=1 Tax=Caerostris darwini TaxID=1538125 RepID=A0AAV4NM16_9ARAC|nr:hypothetical protein CDAR_444821 [Caerostris darwini]
MPTVNGQLFNYSGCGRKAQANEKPRNWASWHHSSSISFQSGSRTRDFTYLHNKKYAGVRSGEHDSPLNLQPQLITWSSVKVFNMNILISCAKRDMTPSCMKMTTGNVCLFYNAATTCSQKYE